MRCGDPAMMSRTAPQFGCGTRAIMLSAVGSTNSIMMHSSATTGTLAKFADESWRWTHAPEDIQPAIRTTITAAIKLRIANHKICQISEKPMTVAKKAVTKPARLLRGDSIAS